VFDRHVVVGGSLRESADGLSVDLRLPYYRGVELSMVTVDLWVDGEKISRDDLGVEVHGNRYAARDLGTVVDDRWPFTEAATIHVTRAGKLDAGSHEVKARVHVRVAYAPNGFDATDKKTLTVAEDR
jgi:hypothetical protein